MKIKIEKKIEKKTQLLCGFVFENSNKVLGMDEFDAKTTSIINQSLKDMEGKLGKINIIPISEQRSIQRILLAGLGKKEDMTKDTIRFVSGKIAQKAREIKIKEFSIIVPPNSVTDQTLSVAQIVEGSKMSLYKFDKFKTDKMSHSPNLTVIVSNTNKISKAIRIAEIVSEGAIFTKSIANLPPNECTPTTLANLAKMISKTNKMKCNVISKSELKKKGFGGITAVGQGSKNETKTDYLRT